MKEKIHLWLNNIESQYNIDQKFVALNFGIYETEQGYCIYMVGSRKYDEENDGWAEDAEDFSPEIFLEITILEDWRNFQKDVEYILSEELSKRGTNPNSAFYKRIVTTGFDDAPLRRIV